MSSNALTNTTISKTYVGVLHSRGSQLPASGQRDIFDGIGQRSALKLGRDCNGATICGPLSATEILSNNVKVGNTNIIDVIYPIGAVIFNTGDNPGNHIPNTTWIQISQGKFIVGVGEGSDTNNNVRTFVYGNANTGTYVNPATIPPHRHGVGNFTSSGNDDVHFIYGDWNDGTTYTGRWVPGNTNTPNFKNITGSPFGVKTSLPVEVTSDPTTNISNTPPSFGLYVWQRTQ